MKVHADVVPLLSLRIGNQLSYSKWNKTTIIHTLCLKTARLFLLPFSTLYFMYFHLERSSKSVCLSQKYTGCLPVYLAVISCVSCLLNQKERTRFNCLMNFLLIIKHLEFHPPPNFLLVYLSKLGTEFIRPLLSIQIE